MDRLIYTAVSGMSDSMIRERVIASNMANTSTIGFKAEKLFTTPITLKGPALEARAMAEGEVKSADMSAGNITHTGRKLDVSMLGDAMMAVQSIDGTESYTRRGDLTISPTGVLENGDGRPVIGNGGPITLPLDAQVSIGPDGMILVANVENPGQPPIAADRIKLASPAGSTIAKSLDGLFRVVGGGVLPQDENAKLVPESLEQSNVNPSEVLIQMIQAQRLYDIRTKVIATAKEVDQSGTSLLRLSSS